MKLTLGAIESTINGYVRTLKLWLYGNNDSRNNISEASPAGIDSNPLPGMVGLYARTENNGQPVCVGYIDPQKIVSAAKQSAPGETRIFSTDGTGAVVMNVYLTNSGDALIGASATPADYNDFAVSYNKLAEAFNQLKQDYDSHSHYVSILNAPCGAPVLPTTAVIEPSKINNIKYIQP